MVNITFLFTSEGHEAIWESCILFFSGCLAFSQGQILTHTGKVWSETFVPVPWSFLTRPGTNSHTRRHSLVLRLLPQFLGAFSQGQVPTHAGKVPLLVPTECYGNCLFDRYGLCCVEKYSFYLLFY
jgi:hypothetical protein